MTEEQIFQEQPFEIEQREYWLYVFDLSKAEQFRSLLESVPKEEIGSFQVWTATVKRNVLFEEEQRGSIFDIQPVFCLQVDFKEEHQHLRQLAEQESLFYIKDNPEDRSLINMFFGSQERDSRYYEYLNSINK